MISQKGILRISVILGILLWSLLMIIDILELFSTTNDIAFGVPEYVGKVLLALFVVSLVIYYRYNIGKAESINFVDLLWRVFVTGLLATIVSLGIETFFTLFGPNKFAANPLLVDFFYHIILGLVLAFLISTFIVWKRLILYQKSKSLLSSWRIYEYFLGATLLFDLFGFENSDSAFMGVYAVLLVSGFVLSFNLKWIAYLNFKQKWKSILFVLLVIIYLWYFFKTLMFFSEEFVLVRDLLDSAFVLSLFSFILLYSAISVLVILFNLPTTSVFEKKLEEAVNFQRLSESIPAGENEEKVYEILLDSAMSAVYSDGAWLEINDENEHVNLTLTHNLDKSKIPDIKSAIQTSKFKKTLNSELDRNPENQKISARIKDVQFHSILLYPVTVKNKKIGTLALLKEVDDGFNKEMINIIDTFVNQASISIENFRLLREAIKTERYKEELNIASRVQKSLLPGQLEKNSAYEMAAFSRAADEVGGDYYDVFNLDENRTAIIIADVSGKGTSAAFHMAQMKGVFHSLVQMDIGAQEFLVRANDALSRCLEKTSFITVSYYVVNRETKKVSFARAGHCPTLFYNSESKETHFFQNKGLGLGILRNSEFHKYVQVNEFDFSSGDIMLLYTDGITEASNDQKQQFGYERLQSSLIRYTTLEPEKIQEGIIKDLYEFCGVESLDDDYTLLIVKFN